MSTPNLLALISLVTLAFVAPGCGPRPSPMRAGELPLAAPADRAVIVFAGDVPALGRAPVFTVLDERDRFVGALSEHSVFATEVAAGRHVFHLVDLRAGKPRPYDCALTVTADVEPGKIYVVWLRFDDPRDGGLGYRVVVPRPDPRADPGIALRRWSRGRSGALKATRTPDRAAGQRLVDAVGAPSCLDDGASLRAAVRIEPADGFERLPR